MNAITKNLLFSDYQAIDALNSGKIRDALKSLRYMRRRELTPQAEFNYTFEVGKAFAYLCEGWDQFKEYVRVGPTKTAGTIAWMEELEANPELTLLTGSDYSMVQAMYKACEEQEHIAHLLKGEDELTFTWTCDRTGAFLKGRCDMLVDIGNGEYHLVDMKTTSNIYKYRYSIKDYRYDVQLAMYADGLRHNGYNITKCSNLFVEKVDILPEVYLHTYNQNELAKAWDDYIGAIEDIQHARETNEYPGYLPISETLIGL